jgi:hypothetical protein
MAEHHAAPTSFMVCIPSNTTLDPRVGLSSMDPRFSIVSKGMADPPYNHLVNVQCCNLSFMSIARWPILSQHARPTPHTLATSCHPLVRFFFFLLANPTPSSGATLPIIHLIILARDHDRRPRRRRRRRLVRGHRRRHHRRRAVRGRLVVVGVSVCALLFLPVLVVVVVVVMAVFLLFLSVAVRVLRRLGGAALVLGRRCQRGRRGRLVRARFRALVPPR